jgi:hypothetical protein
MTTGAPFMSQPSVRSALLTALSLMSRESSPGASPCCERSACGLDQGRDVLKDLGSIQSHRQRLMQQNLRLNRSAVATLRVVREAKSRSRFAGSLVRLEGLLLFPTQRGAKHGRTMGC